MTKVLKTPDYFKHIETGIIYACIGTDGGYYWAEDPDNQFECLKFDPCDCEPLSEEQLKAKAETIFTFEDYATNPDCNYQYIIQKMVEFYTLIIKTKL